MSEVMGPTQFWGSGDLLCDPLSMCRHHHPTASTMTCPGGRVTVTLRDAGGRRAQTAPVCVHVYPVPRVASPCVALSLPTLTVTPVIHMCCLCIFIAPLSPRSLMCRAHTSDLGLPVPGLDTVVLLRAGSIHGNIASYHAEFPTPQL